MHKTAVKFQNGYVAMCANQIRTNGCFHLTSTESVVEHFENMSDMLCNGLFNETVNYANEKNLTDLSDEKRM